MEIYGWVGPLSGVTNLAHPRVPMQAKIKASIRGVRDISQWQSVIRIDRVIKLTNSHDIVWVSKAPCETHERGDKSSYSGSMAILQ
jgi:hypothetical protein